MKNLSKADVFDVVTDLIEENGSTTTLDIKNELRERGFFAKQADVSEFMQQIADSEDIEFNFNGVHRVYTIKTSRKVQTQKINTGNTMHVYTATQYVKRDGTEIETIDKCDSESGDYRVWSVNHDEELYFGDIGYTRSDLRQAYASICGVKFADTRVETL